MMDRGYSALGIVARLYQIAGVLVAIGAVLLGISEISIANRLNGYSYNYSGIGATTGMITIIAGILSGIGFYAVGELINLFRDMELNSRKAAFYAASQAKYARQSVALLQQLANQRPQAGNYPVPPGTARP